jgi:ABC-type Fe3+-hydroxamate transport system substrate-binding protein
VRRSQRFSLPALSLALVALFALSACGEKPEPKGARVPLYPVSVHDADGRLVALESKPERIGVAGGAPERIAGSLQLQTIPVGTSDGGIDLGLVRTLRPGLILAGTGIDPRAISQAKALGIPVYVTPDRTLDGIEQALSDVGLLTGVPLRARRERELMAEKRMRVQTAVARLKPVTVFFDRGRFATYSNTSFVGRLITEAGGSNVAGADVQDGSFPISRLRRLNPEVLVVRSDSKLTIARLRGNPLLKWLSAVRHDRLVRVDMNLFEPGPEAVLGLSNLAAALHPDAFH